jgi:hypothetical protein
MKCALPKLYYKYIIILSRTTSNKTIDLSLVKDANSILTNRLVCVLNKALKALTKDNKVRLSNRISCIY